MGLRFRKSIKIAPGIRLNVGKKSTGISIGGKYGGISVNSRTGARARVSAPGTGLSYTESLGVEKQKSGGYSSQSVPEIREVARRQKLEAAAKPQQKTAEQRAEELAEKKKEKAKKAVRAPVDAAGVKAAAKWDWFFAAIAAALVAIFRNSFVIGLFALVASVCLWDLWRAYKRTNEVIAANVEANRKLDIEAGFVPSSEQ